MKTETQEKFDRIIKESFIEILKPLGFKKKANNFYLPLEKIGHIINIQKSFLRFLSFSIPSKLCTLV
ncbi:DUF4304 domain-containing protein [Sphingobacterium sp. 2149]|uniref:DUF4304 domain-containing protein n=1 Tax=Sphingobacterium sp. 2149 TaxID=2817763 RepID=UPI0038F614F5